jgi:hypothetical protein
VKASSKMTIPQLLAPQLTAEDVLRITRLDADRVYRDLTRFVIRTSREADGWHVDFDLKDTAARGGGPHYIIDVESGIIIAKRYEQ